MANLPRTQRSVQGGIALYARKGLQQCVHVVRKEAERGVLWVRVAVPGADSIHLALCYIPPADSTIRARTSPERHKVMQAEWQALGKMACEVGRSGHVVVMGDLNARTGMEADTLAALQELEDLDIEASCDPVARKNEDGVVNAQGRCLLSLCKEAGLVILNGRLPGDEHGSFTFESANGRSAVDYFLASPGLTFGVDGAALPGCSLSVLPVDERPCLPTSVSNRFDHSPVKCNLFLPASHPPTPHAGEQPQRAERVVAYRAVWEDSMRDVYMGFCLTSPDVTSVLDRAEQAQSIDSAASLFAEGVWKGMECLQSWGHRVFRPVSPGHAPAHKPRCNSWFDEGCRKARQEHRIAVSAHGPRSTEAREKRAAYARVRRAAKRTQAEALLTARIQQWYREPKRFWKNYQGRKAPGPLDSDLPGWTSYFDTLFKGQGQGNYTGGSLEAHLKQHEHILGPAQAPEHTGQLGNDISVAEVSRALSMLARHKAAGPDGIPAEFLSEAYEWADLGGGQKIKSWALAARFARLFTRVFTEGYPKAWGTCALTPVPKPKGNPTCRDDYRGIAVSGALSKLYSLVLLNRLDPWAEAAGVRAVGQSGFRQGRGAMDNAIVLQHLCEKYKGAGLPLYAAFIDFRKAYDCVDRNLLWHALRQLGVQGRMLAALQSMYGGVEMRVRAGGGLGQPFPADTGVRQGDPLSPLLFGLFIDRLEGWLGQRHPEAGAVMAGGFTRRSPAEGARLLRLLLYADDLLILAHTPTDLQAMLNSLNTFCVANRLTVNTAKSVVMVCGQSTGADGAFYYDGNPVPVRGEFVYVGVPFGPTGALPSCMQTALSRATSICQALHSRSTVLGVHNVMVRCSLFNSLVMPVLSYGCEVWGPIQLRSMCRAMGKWGGCGSVEQLHRSFLYRCFGVKPSTPIACIMSAVDRVPVVHAWLARVLGWWNGVIRRPGDDVVRMALGDCVSQASVLRQRDTSSWASSLLTTLHAVDPSYAQLMRSMQGLPRAEILHSVKVKWQAAVWEGWGNPSPATPPATDLCPVRTSTESAGFKLQTYHHWFRSDFSKGKVFAYHLHLPQRISAIARLFFGAHDLEIERGRFRGGRKVPRDERKCCMCSQTVEDECHFLLECEAYDVLRKTPTCMPAFATWNKEKPATCSMRLVTQAGNDKQRWDALAEYVVRAEAQRRTAYRQQI